VPRVYAAESLAEQTTTSGTYGDAVTLTFTPTASKTYAIVATAQVGSGSTDDDGQVRLRHDTASVTANEANMELRGTGDHFPFHGLHLYVAPGSPTEQTWSIEVSSEGSNTTAIKDARLVAIELGPNDLTGELLTPASTTAAIGSYLSVTTTAGHDWLVLGAADLRAEANTATFSLFQDSSDFCSLNHATNQDATTTTSRMGVASGSGAATYDLRYGNNGGTTSHIRNARIVALRMDNWDGFASSLTASNASATTSADYQTGYTLTTTPTAGEHVIIGMIGPAESNNSVNGVRFLNPASGTLAESVSIGLSGGNVKQGVVAYVAELTATSQTWTAQYRSNGSASITPRQGGFALFPTAEGGTTHAATATGTSVTSGSASAATNPDAVVDLAATAGTNEATLTWTAPADNGSAITDYVVQYRVKPS